ncbi:MAG: hypothetical protein AVDCRST_MAG85-3019, partial [uncultured Solirubrobacteraceae bacterium]
ELPLRPRQLGVADQRQQRAVHPRGLRDQPRDRAHRDGLQHDRRAAARARVAGQGQAAGVGGALVGRRLPQRPAHPAHPLPRAVPARVAADVLGGQRPRLPAGRAALAVRARRHRRPGALQLRGPGRGVPGRDPLPRPRPARGGGGARPVLPPADAARGAAPGAA